MTCLVNASGSVFNEVKGDQLNISISPQGPSKKCVFLMLYN